MYIESHLLWSNIDLYEAKRIKESEEELQRGGKMNIYPVETVNYFTSEKNTAPEWYRAERMDYCENADSRYENLTGVRKILSRLFK